MTLLIYAFRWLTDTLPHDQQSATYRKRQAEMQEMLKKLSAKGFAG